MRTGTTVHIKIGVKKQKGKHETALNIRDIFKQPQTEVIFGSM